MCNESSLTLLPRSFRPPPTPAEYAVFFPVSVRSFTVYIYQNNWLAAHRKVSDWQKSQRSPSLAKPLPLHMYVLVHLGRPLEAFFPLENTHPARFSSRNATMAHQLCRMLFCSIKSSCARFSFGMTRVIVIGISPQIKTDPKKPSLSQRSCWINVCTIDGWIDGSNLSM